MLDKSVRSRGRSTTGIGTGTAIEALRLASEAKGQTPVRDLRLFQRARGGWAAWGRGCPREKIGPDGPRSSFRRDARDGHARRQREEHGEVKMGAGRVRRRREPPGAGRAGRAVAGRRRSPPGEAFSLSGGTDAMLIYRLRAACRRRSSPSPTLHAHDRRMLDLRDCRAAPPNSSPPSAWT